MLDAFKLNSKKLARLFFCIILILNLGLHIYNISYPAQPVFDEAHFATYAAKYALHVPLSDIHPPLGKALYSTALLFAPRTTYTSNYLFIETDKSLTGNALVTKTPIKVYGDFPYIYLRIFSAIFGLLLALSVYTFLKSLTKNELVPLLGMFLVTLDNALTLETHLILLNGMYLAFGFFALALFFKQRPSPWLAGIMWGLALSVKLIAIVFLGPLIAVLLMYYKKAEWGRMLKNTAIFFITGIVILTLAFLLLNSLLIPVNDYLSYSKALLPELNLDKPVIFPNYLSFLNPLAPHLKRVVVDLTVTLSGYSNAAAHPFQSRWYGWPFMYKPMLYFQEKFTGGEQSIGLVGNPVVWALSSLGVLTSIVLLWKKRREEQSMETNRVFAILLSGYVFSIFPFIFVSRPEFLYHYFAPLIFGIGLITYIFMLELQKKPSQNQKIFLSALVMLVVIGFAIIAPYTYGIPTSIFKWFVPPNF